jgi:hypothetical protein
MWTGSNLTHVDEYSVGGLNAGVLDDETGKIPNHGPEKNLKKMVTPTRFERVTLRLGI